MADDSAELDPEALEYALRLVGRPQMKLKEEQRAAIKVILSGKDVFLWLPTGYGKSVCFELLPFLFDHKLGRIGTRCCSLVLVLSPLIALMVNQVVNLRKIGIKVAIMSGSSQVGPTMQANEMDLKECSLLYSVPEAILGHKWRDCIEMSEVSNRIVAIVVDEAHCVSKW